jgi:hypothetical protein
MPCLSAKVAFGLTLTALGVEAVIAVEGAPTVVISGGALVALGFTFASMFAAGLALADCLDDVGRHQDAATLRRELDEIKRELRKLHP